MGETTAIGWTDKTFNYWIGCTNVGPGCDGCYAEAYDERWHEGAHWGTGAPRKLTSLHNRNNPFRWNKAALASGTHPWVFCSSLSDVFDNEVPDEWRNRTADKQCNRCYRPMKGTTAYDGACSCGGLIQTAELGVFDIARVCTQLRWQFVTKRIGNVPKMLPHDWARNFQHCGIIATMVTQEEVDRDMPKLLRVKHEKQTRWVGLSIEPQIEFIVLDKWLKHIDWVIVGGESAQPHHKPRRFDIRWALSLIRECGNAGVPFFMKQLGHNVAWNGAPSVGEGKGDDPAEWPVQLRVQQFPKVYDNAA